MQSTRNFLLIKRRRSTNYTYVAIPETLVIVFLDTVAISSARMMPIMISRQVIVQMPIVVLGGTINAILQISMASIDCMVRQFPMAEESYGIITRIIITR